MDRNLTELAIRDQSFQYSEDDFWAGLLVSVECIIGFVMLAFVILGCTRIPTLKSPFGMLMVNQNVTQLVACANSGLFFGLGVLLNISLVQNLSRLSGNFSVFLLPIILGSFLLMSLNRFCASIFVFTYKKIFSDFNIRVAIMAHWFGSFFICVWVFGFRECTFIFYHYGWIFTSAPYSEKCGSIVKTYNMYVQLVLSTAIFAFDIATILVLVFLRNRVYSKQSTAVRRREMSFAAQVMIQGLVFFMMGLWYDKGHAWIPGNDQRWKTFFTSSFSVTLMHVFDPSTFRNDSFFTEADENYEFGPDDRRVGCIISTVCLTGVVIQSAVVAGAYNIKNIKGSIFGALILNETFGQFAATLTSFSFFFFGLVLNSIFIVKHSAVFGNASLTIFPIILGSHSLMAFNRFCASSMPFSYRKVFSQHSVIIYIIINWTLPPIIFSYFFLFYGCYFPFFQMGWVFMEALRNEKCGSKLLLLSFSFQFILVFLISLFDILTFVILVTCRRKVFKAQSKDIRKREINFAMQVLIQGGVMMFIGCWYVTGYSYLPGTSLSWKIFVTTTLSSSGTNCLAPIVICFFNAEYRRWIISLFRKRQKGINISVVTSRASK